MDRKLDDIIEFVDGSTIKFVEFLKENVNPLLNEKLEELQLKTDVIIFSGVIRNFFLENKEIRDIDLVLKEKIDVEALFKDYIFNRNSFGGYKIFFNDLKIDLWFLEDTWAFQNQKNLGFELDRYIPSTSFFNFSSICFLWKERKFIYTKDFIRFLKYKKIDVVYKPNSNYALCVVNSIYYSTRYNLKISENLKDYLKYLHNSGTLTYDNIQIIHFGRILYTDKEIDEFINEK